MGIPVVAIVGRPNVGKSSLFNAIARRRISIVDPIAGVTRDRVSTVFEIDDRYFELVDTGGFGVQDRDDLSEHVERQIRYAITQASLILFLVDAREGLTALDRRTGDLLHREHHRVRLIANKVDEDHMVAHVGEFMKLGFGEPVCVSALSGLGRRDLLELILQTLSETDGDAPAEPVMKVALVGRRNTGKSTFINALAGQERVIVSEVPGTTRDSIDVRFEKDGRTLIAIDTAGIRKKSRIADDVEFYGYTRALNSVRRADVTLLFIDSTVAVGQVDNKLGQLIVAEHKPCVIVINKWDLAKGQAGTDAYGDYLGRKMPMLNYAPLAFTSATQSRNIDSTIDLASVLFKQAHIRVGTGRLNQILQQAIVVGAPKPKRGSKAPKFFYATQASVAPPTIVVFVNNPVWVTQNFQRYMVNRLRENLPFDEVPIRLLFRARSRPVSRPRRPRRMPHA